MHLSEQVTIDRGAIEAPDIGDYAPRVSIYAPGDNSDAVLQEFGTYSFSVDAGKMLLRSGRWRLEGETFEVGIDGTVGCADCVVSGTADVCYRKYYKDDGDDDVDAIRLSSGTVDMLRFAVCEVTLPNGTVIEKSSKNENTGFSVSAGGIIYNFQSAAAFKVKDAHGKTYDFAMSADGSALTCTDSEGTTSSYAMDAESPKAILLSEEGVGLAVIAATKEGDKLSLTLPALSADEEAVLTDADGMVYGILAYQGQSDESVGGTYTLAAESNAVTEIDLSNLGTATLRVNGAKLGASTKYTAKGGSFTTGDKDFTVTQNGAQITLSDAERVTLLQAGDYKFTTATKATASAQGTYIINGNSYALSQNAEISVNGTATELTAGSVTLAKGNTVTVGTTAYTAAANNTSLANSGGKAKLTAGTVTLAKGKTLTVGKTTYTAAANNTTLDYNGGKAKLTVGTVTLDKGESVVVASLGTVTAKTGSLDVTSTGVLTGTSVDATAIKNTGTLTIKGNNSANLLKAGSGKSKLYGYDGKDTLLGGAGSDMLDGGAGNDSLSGGNGNDSLTGGAGNDTLNGGAGNDSLVGGNGNDSLTGGAGNDTLNGGAGNDSLVGGAGNDSLSGGKGNDSLWGGAGNDTLTGGAGKDIFLYSKGDGKDVICSYNATGKHKAGKGYVEDVVLCIGNGSVRLDDVSLTSTVHVIDASGKKRNYTVSSLKTK